MILNYLHFSYPFISQSRIIICRNINDPAVTESHFCQQPLHNKVISVRIHPQMPTLSVRPFPTKSAYAFYGSVACQSMNHTVGAVIIPFSLFNRTIAWFDFFANIIEKCAIIL